MNVNKRLECAPDQVLDLECVPWPWDDSIADRVALHHVLEHLGPSSETFLRVMQELWRVCKDGTLIEITVPHPRADEFLWDPTHVRPITVEGLRMFSQARNQRMITDGNPETPLGLYIGIDFEIEDIQYRWHRRWREKLALHEIAEAELSSIALSQLNVISETTICMLAVKPPRHSS